MQNIFKSQEKWLLCAVFLALLPACAKSHQSDQMPEKGEELSGQQPGVLENNKVQAEQKKEEMVFKGPGEKLPLSVGEFKISSPPRYFGPANLYDLINGGAEIYVEYGLKEMVTADYKDPSRKDLTITVEVYDQATLLGAFGRLARFLSGKVNPSGSGQGLPQELEDRGLFGGSDLLFFQGRFLVHITLLDESPEATQKSIEATGKALLPTFATAVAKKIPDNPPLPRELKAFPSADKVGRSETWELKDLGGIKGLNKGFTARYSAGDSRFLLFIAKSPTAEAQSLEKIGKENEDAIKEGKIAIEQAGESLIGFAALTDPWSDKEKKRALTRVQELKKVL